MIFDDSIASMFLNLALIPNVVNSPEMKEQNTSFVVNLIDLVNLY